MFILLHGQDSYRSRQKLKDVIEEYKKIHKSGLSLAYLDGENLKFEDFKDAIKQVSMFEEKKLLVLSNVFTNQDFKEKFLKNFKEFAGTKDTILFYENDKISGKDKFFNFLKSKAKTQDFSLLGGEKLKTWIKQEFLKFKAEISPEAVDKLIDIAGNDLWFLSNEIKKLVNYKKGERVNAADVVLLVDPKIETAIFKTIDAISQKNKEQALLLVHQHLEKGDNPLYLLSMINFQFKNLLIVKDLMEKHEPYYLISKKAQLHPFVVRKSYQQAGRFTFLELKKIYRKIFQADLEIKTGKISPETALDLFIAGI
jgi:DNA polymerase-3 subunit delta